LACITLPIKTSSTFSGAKLIFFIAPLIAAAPHLVAGTLDKLPKKLPIGVLTADTI